ncbi:MAG: hypothetical protein Q8941_04135 [Bacteroidota bacterium]|nr:hypothetical protein [Bacteroidota bacterium]
MKQIVVLFDAPGFTATDFDQTWDDLRAAGITFPKGLISHAGFANPTGNWNVVDIWESAEAFAEFGKTLIPIFQKRGFNVPEPKVIPAHYVIYKGQPEEVPA